MADTSSSIRVTVVDDQPIVREGLAALLRLQNGVEVVGEHGDVESALEAIGQAKPDLVLLDIMMPGASVFPMVTYLRSSQPLIKLVMLTGYPSDDHCQKAFQAGANGFISKAVNFSHLRTLIQSVMAGGRVVYTPHQFAATPNEETLDSTSQLLRCLTKREVEVLRRVGLGMNAGSIGKDLFISKRTVDRHKANIMAKLNASSQLELMRLAIRMGLVHPSDTHVS